VTVVIATRRRPQLLARCLGAVLAQRTDAEYEVIVVNDDDDAFAAVPRDDRIVVVESGGRGVASARNRGARVARSPLLVFTDDDTEPAPDWLDRLLAASRRAPAAVGFEGPVETGDYDLLYFHAPRAHPGGCCGANVAYRRAPFLELGGFDERFYGWMPEDVEFGTRAKARGEVVYVPEMVVRHPPRPIGVRERMAQASRVEGTWLLFRKHPSLSAWRVPLRWGPALAEFKRWSRLLTRRDIVRGSPERAFRIVVLTVCTTASAAVAGWRQWPGLAGGRAGRARGAAVRRRRRRPSRR
jgi:GT2 family glycosyltransferase